MTIGRRVRLLPLFLAVILVPLFFIFYWKYVPLVPAFQAALVPVLLLTLVLTLIHPEKGIFCFCFSFPLVNSLPYFFSIDLRTPHAPTALVLFLVFALAWLIRQSFSRTEFSAPRSLFRPLALFSLIILVSGALTFFRYTNFFPFLSDDIYEIIVNSSGVRAGGALMSVLFSSLNYLTGFFFFIILVNTIRSIDTIKKILILMASSFSVSLAFSFFQAFHSPDVGNTAHWISLGRINSTFKDPNSFGVYLAAFLIILLGLSFVFRKLEKIVVLVLIVSSMIIFPFIGSRSGLLGLGVGLAAFVVIALGRQPMSFRKKLSFGLAIILAFVLAFSAFRFFYQKSNLYQRIESSIGVLSEQAAINSRSMIRLDFWRAALQMIKDYPLTGVGVGAYIVELPNYQKTLGIPYEATDSAESYFLQVGSELGAVGFVFVIWIFWQIFRAAGRSWKNDSWGGENRFVLIALLAGIISVMTNFIFHSYIGSFEVKYFFWLLVAGLFIMMKDTGTVASSGRYFPRHNLFWICIILIFGVIHLVNSFRSLAVDSRTTRFGWPENFGLYQLEKDDRRFYFRWANQSAGMTVERVGKTLVVPIIATHPGIDREPVHLQFFLASQNFKRKKLWKDFHIEDHAWRNLELEIPASEGEMIRIVVKTSRTWQPLKHSGVPDPRNLAVGIGEVWFKYPDSVPEERIVSVQTISNQKWEGPFKERLWGDGISTLRFEADHRPIAVRLHLKGVKALGIGPYLIFRIDGQLLGRTMLTSEGWTSLAFLPDISPGEHILSAEYTNDFWDHEAKQDRNVYLGDVEVIRMK